MCKMSKQRKNQWGRLFNELITRAKNAFCSIGFVLFFFGGVLIVGGIGVWLPAYMDKDISYLESQNVFTYTVAIIGTLFIEFVFQDKKNHELTLLGAFCGLIALLLCSLGFMSQTTGVSSSVSAGLFLTLCIYFFSYANDPRFDGDESSPADPTGYKNADVSGLRNE